MTERTAGSSAARDPYRTVLEVGATLTASLDLDEVFATIARQVGEALDVQWCDINEYDQAANTMTYVAVWAEVLRQEDLDYVGTVVDLAERPGRDAVIRKGDLLETYIDDPDLDDKEREVMVQYNELAIMEMPLVYGDVPIGVLGVIESRRMRRFTDEEKLLLRLLAGPAAVAIGNARAYRAQREQARRTRILLDSSRVMATSTDLEEVLASVARLAVDAVDGSQSAIYEYREDLDAIVYKALYERVEASTGEVDDELGTVYPLKDYPGERLILEQDAVLLEQRSDPDLPADRRASMDAWGEHTCLNLPLSAGGRPMGILRLYEMERERRYTGSELELLTSLAELASASIQNARLFGAQRRHSSRLLELFGVSRGLAATFDLGDIVDAVTEGAAHLAGAGVSVEVWLRGDDGVLAPAADVVAGTAASLAAPAIAQEVLGLLRPQHTVGDYESALAIPFVAKGQAEGLVLLRTPGMRHFGDAEIEALQVLANQTAAALENRHLYRRVEQQAIRDGLTGLYNHRHFQERLVEEVARAERYGLPLSLLMLDLDDFKKFNDRYGHQLGDEVLREVGEIIATSIRQGVDFPARYGGEEFAVLLPHTHASWPERATESEDAGAVGDAAEPPVGLGALVVAERLRAAVADHRFAGHGGRREARIRTTIGVATFRETSGSPDSLVSDADKALYAGKAAGKNRVELYVP